MSKDIDLAQEVTDLFLEKTLNNRVSFVGDSLYECDECGDAIPEKRRKLGNVKYCIECQSNLEMK